MIELIQNADVYSPRSEGVSDLLIAGRTVAWIGGTGTGPIDGASSRPDVRITDLAGRRLIPGLVDCHVHITGGGGEAGPASSVPPLAGSALLGAGVTTVVGVLGTDDVTRSPASLVARARALLDEGLTAYCYTGSYRVPPVTLTGDVRGDISLVDRIIGAGEIAIADHRSSQPSTADLARIAADAHVSGMLAGKAGTLHLHLGDGNRGLGQIREILEDTELPPRVFHPTHVNRRRALFEEALDLARRGCTIDVTAFPVAEDEDAWSAAEAVDRFLAADVPPDRITVSSDAGGSLPVFDDQGRLTGMDVAGAESLVAALSELVRLGRTLEEALPPFTSNVADILRLPVKGRIREGGDADLVVLDESGAVADVIALGTWRIRSATAT